MKWKTTLAQLIELLPWLGVLLLLLCEHYLQGIHFSASICLTLCMKNLPSFISPAASDKWNGITEILRTTLAMRPPHKVGPAATTFLLFHTMKLIGGEKTNTLLGSDSSAFFSPLIYILHKQGYNNREGHSFTLNFWIFSCWSMKWQLHRITSYGKSVYHHLKSQKGINTLLFWE